MLELGRTDRRDTWLVASETCAFDLVGAEYVREVEPGEMVRISEAGVESIRFAPQKPHQYCIFEHVYFARPDSIVFGRSGGRRAAKLWRAAGARASRRRRHRRSGARLRRSRRGRLLARIRLPFRMGLIRNHYIGRTFIEPDRPFAISA